MSWGSPVSPQSESWVSPVLSVGLPGRLQINTAPPTTALSGIPLLIAPIIGVLTAFGISDLLYIGPVSVTLVGTGTLTGLTTTLAVAGIALFLGLTITGSGVFQLKFTLPSGAFVLSANITVL